MQTTWNKHYEPISTRLRDEQELQALVDSNKLIFNPNNNETAIIVEVFKVSYEDDDPENEYDPEEDRWVEYITTSGPKEDFSVDLDDEGWIWYDEILKEKK